LKENLTSHYSKLKENELQNVKSEIWKSIEEVRKIKKEEVIWRGLVYADIMKYERWIEEQTLKAEIREEIVSNKLKRMRNL